MVSAFLTMLYAVVHFGCLGEHHDMHDPMRVFASPAAHHVLQQTPLSITESEHGVHTDCLALPRDSADLTALLTLLTPAVLTTQLPTLTGRCRRRAPLATPFGTRILDRICVARN
ncbi:hypothetical protein D5S17_11855 [Pseudonocardiaceae bacterium YIM PH 21723]|nr:hypothetical protein D5S17_11855 [Pseudonocardiaceae bacterium YIM PH 21723]